MLSLLLNPLQQLLLIIAITLGLLSLASYWSESGQFFELVSHFRIHYFFGLLVCLLFQCLWRQKIAALITLFFCGMAVLPVIPYYMTSEKGDIPKTAQFKIVQLNVLVSNPDIDAVETLISTEKPDLIGIEEVNPLMGNVLKRVLKDYPYRLLQPRKDTFGIALFSKRPFTNAKVLALVPPDPSQEENNPYPSLMATLTVNRHPVTIMVTHPTTPFLGFGDRNAQMAAIAERRTQFGSNLVVFGDFNCTPWSAYFQELLIGAGLRDSQLGFGIQPSWPSYLPDAFRIPIDHILVSDGIQVLERRLGPNVGSDHLPVIAVLGVKPSP